MEAYDISNINGFETVGSMIVYEKGKPKKSDYRKFKLRTVTGPDDYASMHEVLTRRFTHGMEEQKQLEKDGSPQEIGSFNRFPDIIMMDGGRGQVNICLQVLSELGLDIPVCGMVKDDFHRTRGLYYNNVEIPIDRHGDDIEGIGPARRKSLMRRYQSLEKIKEADVEDLMQTETMNEKAAQAVYAFFHSAT